MNSGGVAVAEKKDVKMQINDFCLNHVFNNSAGMIPIGRTPMAIVVYLGRETENQLSELLENAFSSMLCVDPQVQTFTIESTSDMDAETFMRSLTEKIRIFLGQGRVISGVATNIQLSFVALMDDPLLSDPETEKNLSSLREAIDDIEMLGKYTLGDPAFFGFFFQAKTKKKFDYSQAMHFINKGSSANENVWNRIFHLQRDLIADSYETECRTAAMQILHDALFIKGHQPPVCSDPENYRWYRLGLDEMKLPEQLICNMLIRAYRMQLSSAPLDNRECEIFRKTLEQELLNEIREQNPILRYDEWVNYLPRNPEERRFIEQKSGLFGFGKKIIEVGGDTKSMLIDENQLDVILTEKTQDMIVQFAKPEILAGIYRKALHALSRIDSASTRLRDALIHQTELVMKTMESERMRIPLRSEAKDVEPYLQELFQKYAEKEAYEFALDVLKTVVGNDEFSRTLKKTIENVQEDVSVVVNSLEDLRVNSYGGTPSLSLPRLDQEFTLSVDTPIKDACKAIDRSILNSLVNDSSILDNNRQAAMDKARQSSVNQNAIGSTKGEFGCGNMEYTVMVDRYFDDFEMHVKNSEMFRANTMLILSSCLWESQKNLYIYYGGE